MRLIALAMGTFASVRAAYGDVDVALVDAVLAVAAALLSLRPSKFAARVRDEIELYESRRVDED